MDVKSSSHGLPMGISAHGWRWGEICDILDLVYNKGLRFSSSQWVACIIIPYGRITCVTWVVLNLFSHGVFTSMLFYVVHVSLIPYIGLLVGVFPLQLLHSLVFLIKFSDILVLLLLIKILFLLVTVSDHNRHASYGMPHMLPFILLRCVSFAMSPSAFLKRPYP